MANNYQLFSTGIKNITPGEAAWIETFLGEEPNTENPKLFEAWCDARGVSDEDDAASYPDFEWSVSKKDAFLWMYSEEWGNLVHLAVFVQTFLQTFRPNDTFGMTYCEYCSKPRIDEFGGGWVAISAQKIQWGDTYSAVAQDERELHDDLNPKTSQGT